MSLRTKQDYFDVAERLGLPKRCPVFEWCERRADTVAVFNELDFEVAKKSVNLKEPIVKRIGESAGRIGGPNYYSCSGLCPEVFSFLSGRWLCPIMLGIQRQEETMIKTSTHTSNSLKRDTIRNVLSTVVT